MLMKRFFTLIAIGLCLCSCAEMVAPSAEQLRLADCGAPPKDPRSIVMGYIKANFKDPYSIQDLQIGVPFRTSETAPPLLGGKTVYGYKIPFSVNAKNSYGAYNGVQQYVLFTYNGKIIPGAAGLTQDQINQMTGL